MGNLMPGTRAAARTTALARNTLITNAPLDMRWQTPKKNLRNIAEAAAKFRICRHFLARWYAHRSASYRLFEVCTVSYCR